MQIIGGGAVASGGNALSAVKSRAVDSAVVIYAYAPSEIPVISMIGDFPGNNTPVAAAATTETMLIDCPQCREEMDRVGVEVLINVATEPYNFMCRSDAVATPADLQGKKVRATGVLSQLVAQMGGTTVNIAYNEIYEGMQRGQIDCTILGASNLKGVQVWDVAKTLTDLSLGTFNSYGLLLVNQDLWKGMSADDRQRWIGGLGKLMSDHARVNLEVADEALETGVNEKGLKVVEPTAELASAVKDFQEKQIDLVLATARERGVENPEGIVARYQQNVVKWQAIAEEIGEQPWTQAQWDAFGARVQSEIYARVALD